MKTRNCAKCRTEFQTKAKVGRGFSYCRSCCSEKRKLEWKNNKTRIAAQNKASHIKRLYGLSKQEYENLLNSQSGMCAICNTDRSTKEGWRSLSVDHCHKTGKVRGLLCQNCNTSLGKFQDNIQILMRAIEYLKKFENST
jgi:predicted transcriptional regulator YheO